MLALNESLCGWDKRFAGIRTPRTRSAPERGESNQSINPPGPTAGTFTHFFTPIS